ncbi:S-ribosylhomocysteine lyase [Clostridium botulinum]|uniref:S-ribosylhomocysteine lyase n=1 Tax=Clostridium botulinum TaxID=1491 RepID=UPI0005F95019|nr:S-ribosylhomocysteine lyase [Clostridium botulinum]MBY6799178.1 S-ribosylhomocysteine lyase [Clostridium botulinum]NFB56570.1 S-ribosylhomocysteine lyase [Clostridium botulinum]NFB60993.1 S-ribosylhomocysteine lyase [Clostridium botulinum]NFC27897.1 S-ribosylhomocysteine lyase [Clostridium botulinum]NFC62669.1 S-ribosylhomocysteine lyase [Clostridium botulinum]
MINLEKAGWNCEDVGNIDHRNVKAPYIRMINYNEGENGDVVFSYDLRLTQPNSRYMDTKVLHSLEHFMLVGFQKYFDKKFVSVSPMGCQTGFYLIIINEYNFQIISEKFKKVLEEILEADSVPLSTEITCGQANHHTLKEVKELVGEILKEEKNWKNVM